MEENLCITLPLIVSGINDNALLKSSVASIIIENESQFLPLLERLIDMGDARMTVIEGSLNIKPVDVEVSPTGGVAFGTFESDFFVGCKDMNSQDDHEVSLKFDIEDSNLVFNIQLPPAWRPDEHE